MRPEHFFQTTETIPAAELVAAATQLSRQPVAKMGVEIGAVRRQVFVLALLRPGNLGIKVLDVHFSQNIFHHAV